MIYVNEEENDEQQQEEEKEEWYYPPTLYSVSLVISTRLMSVISRRKPRSFSRVVVTVVTGASQSVEI